MTAVLFTCAGQRVDIVSAFGRAGGETIAADVNPLAPALYAAAGTSSRRASRIRATPVPRRRGRRARRRADPPPHRPRHDDPRRAREELGALVLLPVRRWPSGRTTNTRPTSFSRSAGSALRRRGSRTSCRPISPIRCWWKARRGFGSRNIFPRRDVRSSMVGPEQGRVSVTLHLWSPTPSGGRPGRRRGPTVERPPADAPYGRTGVIIDPYGHRWMCRPPPGRRRPAAAGRRRLPHPAGARRRPCPRLLRGGAGLEHGAGPGPGRLGGRGHHADDRPARRRPRRTSASCRCTPSTTSRWPSPPSARPAGEAGRSNGSPTACRRCAGTTRACRSGSVSSAEGCSGRARRPARPRGRPLSWTRPGAQLVDQDRSRRTCRRR